MIGPWNNLNPQEREIFRATVVFLEKRLLEQGTIDWALKLKPGQRIERIAIEYLLDSLVAQNLAEPWVTAWRLIEESWSFSDPKDRDGTAVYGIQKRLKAGDRSGAAVAAILRLVSPRLKVEPIEDWRWDFVEKPRKPKSVEQILSARLTSGPLVDLNVLELSALNDVAFLTSLANALDAAVSYGLDIARRLGWDETRSFLSLGSLNRVYYIQPTLGAGRDAEPDAYHRGIAPSVKLLHAVVARIAAIQPDSAMSFIHRWHVSGSSVFLRLWAAMAQSNQLASAKSVQSFLLSINDRQFWDLYGYPEIAELRALRFGEFDRPLQNQIVARLLKGPPRSHWPKKAEKEKVASARQYWIVRELKRIEVAGGILPARGKKRLEAQLPLFVDLMDMSIDSGFSNGVKVSSVPPNPDSRYDNLEAIARLEALETALAESPGGWVADPAERANDWINQESNATKLLADFELAPSGGDDYPRVWNRFGWAHRPRRQVGEALSDDDLNVEAGRVLNLLDQVTNTTLLSAINGICAWLDAWDKHVVGLPLALPIWLRLWPLAVEATNNRPEEDEEINLNVMAQTADDDDEPMDLDTLNTPAGKLVGVFLAACPRLVSGSQAFAQRSIERQMRDVIIAAEGQSGLIARHRMIEALPYFLRADNDWAQENLIRPLLNDDAAALALWRAVARRTHFKEVLKVIGSPMAERATDRRLDRETRRRLTFSLVIESLHALREGREPSVPNPRITQMLRTLDDEVRTSAAGAIQQFVSELSATASREGAEDGENNEALTAAKLFHEAAGPFLREVWPQERSLATPGVSGALADLPATSGEAFVEAVDAIARYLVPFECWSMVYYGLYVDDEGVKKLAIINDEPKALALLKLLDLTVGTNEGAVVPHDLEDALDQIRTAAPGAIGSPEYRRLSTAARR